MVSKWKFRRKATPCTLAEKRMAVAFEKKKGGPSNFQKLYKELLKQQVLAKELKDHGAKKELIDRATLMKWQTKRMLHDLEYSLNQIPLAREAIKEQKKAVERDFEELERYKLKKEVGEMFQSPVIKNMKKIMKEKLEKNSK